MECPMCWELYTSDERIARNLVCGHTYCQICLEKIFNQKKRVECPMCRHKHDPSMKPSLLSKNFVAMELACKHHDIRRKLQMCPTHNKNPLQFYCETDQQHLCSDCIVEHSGHKFCKQEFSIHLLKERIQEIQQSIVHNTKTLEIHANEHDSSKQKLNQEYQESLKSMDLEFDQLIAKVEERRKELKEQFKIRYEEELKNIDTDLLSTQALLDTLTLTSAKLLSTTTELDTLPVLKDNTYIQIVDDLQDQAHKDISLKKSLIFTSTKYIPKLVFDHTIHSDLARFGSILKSIIKPSLCFFGDKHKILIYDIDKEEWHYKQMPQHSLEFNYYASSVSLPTGEIIITGGGLSKQTILVQPKKNFTCIPLKNMFFPRKEHATVHLDGYVYAIGGYDGSQKQMLSSCERYNPSTDEWKIIEPLQKQKCAFAAAAVNNQFIYVFGGFDGRERLNNIEKYTLKDNTWKYLDVKFKHGFSNAAAISHSENQILILGGGSNQGFSLDLQLFDITNGTLKVDSHLQQFLPQILSKMSEGRDLRNKLAFINGWLYSCGGNNCTSEKYSINSNEWQTIKYHKIFKKTQLETTTISYQIIQTHGVQHSPLSNPMATSPRYSKPFKNRQYEYYSDGMSDDQHEDESVPDYEDEEIENLSFGINYQMAQRGRPFQL